MIDLIGWLIVVLVVLLVGSALVERRRWRQAHWNRASVYLEHVYGLRHALHQDYADAVAASFAAMVPAIYEFSAGVNEAQYSLGSMGVACRTALDPEAAVVVGLDLGVKSDHAAVVVQIRPVPKKAADWGGVPSFLSFDELWNHPEVPSDDDL